MTGTEEGSERNPNDQLPNLPNEPAVKKEKTKAGEREPIKVTPILTLIGLVVTAYALFQGTVTRWQDAWAGNLNSLSNRLYDFEKDDPQLYCLYRQAPTSLGCDVDHMTLSPKTIAYVDVAMDWLTENVNYTEHYCQSPDWTVTVFRIAVEDCSSGLVYREQILSDPFGVFRQVADIRLGPVGKDGCNHFDFGPAVCWGDVLDAKALVRPSPTVAASPEPTPTGSAAKP